MNNKPSRWISICVIAFSLIGCIAAPDQAASILITIVADGKEVKVSLPPGSSVQAALDKAGLKLGDLDQVDPSGLTLITIPLTIKVIRIQEEFDVEDAVIPFERQSVRNESLPEGQTLLIQPGANGKQQITYRRLIEDGKETSHTVFKSVTISEAKPEIVMVGVQAPFSAVTIRGRIAYLTNGNAWLMEGTTGNRRPLLTSGDLDGRVFALSPDGDWLLYTRKAVVDVKDDINSLWVIKTLESVNTPINLHVKNVVQYAGWEPVPGQIITYSTVEPRSTPPGWQANNDLQLIRLDASGAIVGRKEILASNSGGIYGWWGTQFSWSPDGQQIAFARPDSVGLLNPDNGEMTTLFDLTPFQTRGDWAWVPGMGWLDNHDALFTVTHSSLPGQGNEESSSHFNISVKVMRGGPSIHILPDTGMFAYPQPSPYFQGKNAFISYLQAVFPEQSESSRYRIVLMDRDGSNSRAVFPPAGSTGLEPQQLLWSPLPMTGNIPWLAFLYQGNLWLLNPITGQPQQVSGDAQINKISWK